MSEHNYRGYFFGNMYLSSIQHGIQAAHVIKEMVATYYMSAYTTADKVLTDWITEDKTMILLNGGYQSALLDLYKDLLSLTDGGSVYPVAKFHEEKDALNGAVTSVGIVLPENAYKESDTIWLLNDQHLNDQLIKQRIKGFRLAT